MHLSCFVVSRTRAANLPSIFTLVEATATTPGPPLGFTQTSMQSLVLSPFRVAGLPPILTFFAPATTVSGGNGGTGTGIGGAGGAVAQWKRAGSQPVDV